MGLFDSKDEKALNYMNKKYGKKFGDSFEILTADYAGLIGDLDEFYLKSKLMPKRNIRLEREKGKYADNYMSNYYLKDYEKLVQPMYQEIIGVCKVMAEDHYNVDKFTEESCFEEIIHSKQNNIAEYILVKEDFKNEEALIIANKIKELELPHNRLYFVALKEKEAFDNISDVQELEKYINEHFKGCEHTLMYMFDNDYNITNIREGLHCDDK